MTALTAAPVKTDAPTGGGGHGALTRGEGTRLRTVNDLLHGRSAGSAHSVRVNKDQTYPIQNII